MATAGELIQGAMRLLGAIASGETPSAAENADGLSALNEMLASWSNDNLIIFKRTREVFSLVGSQQNYLMGDLQDFDTTRPTEITAIAVLRDNQEIPVNLVTAEQWERISLKNLNQSYPTVAYAEVEGEHASIYFWPVPSEADSVVIYSRKPLGDFTNVSDDVLFPDGYYRALRYNLALELAPEYGIEPSQLVFAIAQDSLEKIQIKNSKPQFLGTDPALGGGYYFDYRTGEVV